MIYVPMTCNILTKGHVKLLEKLLKKDDVIVGLLTSKALKGYKKERMPFADRKYILESIFHPLVYVVAQDSLDPTENLITHACDAIATGDKFEKVELAAAKKLKLKKIIINSGCKLHSSDIK